MAKPKFPKKNSVGNGAISPSNPMASMTDPTVGMEAAAEQSESRRSARKPEIVKTDSRPNLFPINLEEEIRRLAYFYSERRGFEPGHETEDWLTAERELRQRYRQQSA